MHAPAAIPDDSRLPTPVARLIHQACVTRDIKKRHDYVLSAWEARLSSFDAERLMEVGRRVRDLYPAIASDRVMTRVSDEFLQALVTKVTSGFGGKVTVAPRVFLRELVDVIDRVEQHEAYDPIVHHQLVLDGETLTPQEVAATQGKELVEPEEESEEEPAPARRLDG